MNNNKKIGLALGGGGARGLAHIGVAKELLKEGIEIDMIAGCSMGAIIGACIALGMKMEEVEDIILKFSSKRKIVSLLDFGIMNGAVMKGEKSYGFLESHFGDATFSKTKIPFSAVATNLNTGEETVISRGRIMTALRASSGVPGIFPPVKIGKDYFIDGGVVNPTPVDVAKDMGADVIIGVDLVLSKHTRLENPNMFTTLMQSYEIIRNQAIKLKQKDSKSRAIIIKPPSRSLTDSFKFHNIKKFIDSGEIAAKEAMPEIKKKIGI